MYDSTNINDDPAGAHMVGYYVDGIFAVSRPSVQARFPNAVLVPISAIGANLGVVGDVEPGCMSIPQSVGWVQMRRAAGVDPTLYVNETYGWGPTRSAFHAAGVPEPHWWVADYDGIAVVPAGAVAKQYENPPMTHGHFDLSIVADFWPGIDGLYGPGGGTIGGATELDAVEDGKLTGIYQSVGDGKGRQIMPQLAGIFDSVGDGQGDQLFPLLKKVLTQQGDIITRLEDIKGRVELIEQSPAIGAEHTNPPGP